MERPLKRTNDFTPLGALALGVGAGVIGTACMTAWQEVNAKLRRRHAMVAGGRAADADPWKHAPAPAKLARRVVEGVFEREVPVERIPLFTNAVHWGYGTMMGPAYALVQASRRGNPIVRGSLFGLSVWTMSYATLVPLGLYDPPWRYKPTTVAKDISYHLVYGGGVAAGFELLAKAFRR